MAQRFDKVFGPMTIECEKFGRFTRFLLWFLPTYIYENQCSIMIYKKWRGTMYVTGFAHKPHQQAPAQHQKPWES